MTPSPAVSITFSDVAPSQLHPTLIVDAIGSDVELPAVVTELVVTVPATTLSFCKNVMCHLVPQS